jgi:hypothetical protein
LVGALGAGHLAAECAALSSGRLSFGESLGLLHGRGVPPGLVSDAIALWRGCANYDSGFPRLLDGERGTRTLTIVVHHGHLGDGRCGSFVGRAIDLYQAMRGDDGRIHPCGSLAQNLAHEIGHAMGLEDAPDERSCDSHIMSSIRASNARGRRVQLAECQVAGQRWVTMAEWEQSVDAFGLPPVGGLGVSAQ